MRHGKRLTMKFKLTEALEENGFNSKDALGFLSFLVYLEGYNHERMNHVPSKLVRKHLGVGHAKIAARMEKVGFIQINRSYCKPKDGKKGWTKQYGVTDYGITQIEEELDEYLLNISSLEVQRVIKKDRRNHKDTYSDLVLSNQKANMEAITFDLPEMIEAMKTFKPRARCYAKRNLIEALEKPFYELERNERTGRVYNCVSGLPKTLKKLLKVSGQPFLCELDARCCHPTFLGLYVLSLDPDNQKLIADVNRYISFFTDENHPREYLAKLLNIGVKAMKEIMNKYLNGGRPRYWKRYDEWLSWNFFELWMVWHKSDIKETGTNISRFYESEIFRNPRVIKKAKELGLLVLDNHDALLVYSSDKQACGEYAQFIKDLAHEIFKINLKMSCDYAEPDEPELALSF